MSIRTAILVPAFLTMLLAAPDARAVFVRVDDFESYSIGPIDDQGDWRAASDLTVVAPDPVDPNNQVLAVTTDSTIARRPLLLLNGTVRMVFLRFQFGQQQSYSFGLSGSCCPDQFGEFEAELSMTNASPDLRVLDEVNYAELLTLQPYTWYNLWILVDNAGDVYSVYLNASPSGDAGPGDLLDSEGQVEFLLRGGSASDLRSFFIKTGGGSSGNVGPLLIDDIYLENDNVLNLSNPLLSGYVSGDLNCDGVVNFGDIDPFVLALTDPDAYPVVYPNCPRSLADVNGDGAVNFGDIDPFVALLTE